MNTKNMLRTAIAGITAMLASIALAVPATAHAQSVDPAPRLERACLRIPNLEIRTHNLIQRLEGDASVLGSLAWLQKQIDRATAANRPGLAEVLSNRLAVRTRTLAIMHQRETLFPHLREFCTAHGVTL